MGLAGRTDGAVGPLDTCGGDVSDSMTKALSGGNDDTGDGGAGGAR